VASTTLGLVIRYLLVLVVTASIASQVLVWLSWFSPLLLFTVALIVGMTVAHISVVRRHRNAKEDD
jgi:multisubunit Na+/H+ antiporter MnhE subunit